VQHDFPNDADGDALHLVVAGGSDLTKPMLVDFQVAAPDQIAAKGIADGARQLGYRVTTYATPECSLPWTCECSIQMLVNYESVVAIQKELARLAAPFGGHPDGWGSFGNKSDEIRATS
jgi:hypothetical protein